jgi:hypothetical protein
MEAVARKSPLYAAAVGIGISAGFVRQLLVGFLAARPWPKWYIPWAHVHKHFALELSWIVMSLLPSVLVAVTFGALLTVSWRRTSRTLVVIAIAAWFVYDLAVEVVADTRACFYPVQCFLEPFRLEPVTSVLSVLIPAAALLGYSWVRSAEV